MRTITSIQGNQRKGERASIFLDGLYAFNLARNVVEEHGLHPGQVLSNSQVEELAGTEIYGKCLNAALRLLRYRPRSEAEIRTRLSRRFNAEAIEEVIFQLRASQMIDDITFAEFWKEERDSFSPRSNQLVKLELRHKGVDPEIVDEVLDGMDDDKNAYRAAQMRMHVLGREDYETFRQKMSAFLRRRGFSYDVVKRTTERLWQEREQQY